MILTFLRAELHSYDHKSNTPKDGCDTVTLLWTQEWLAVYSHCLKMNVPRPFIFNPYSQKSFVDLPTINWFHVVYFFLKITYEGPTHTFWRPYTYPICFCSILAPIIRRGCIVYLEQHDNFSRKSGCTKPTTVLH